MRLDIRERERESKLRLMSEEVFGKELESQSDLELANSWLKRETEETSKRLKDAEWSERFYTTYEPKPPGPRPAWARGSEAAGMDVTDWDNAELEYQQWPEEQEEMLEHLRDEIEALEDKSGYLLEYRGRLERGDPRVIAELAGRERACLAALEAEKRRRTEWSQGIKLEGVEEVSAQLQKLEEIKSLHVGHKDYQLPEGWKIGYSYDDGYRFIYRGGQGPNGGFVTSIAVGKGYRELREQDEITVRYRDFSGTTGNQPGLGLYFHIKGDIVKNHSALELKPWERELHNQKDIGNMNQEQFDKFRQTLSSLVPPRE